jgi:hypothetical protein
MGYNIGAYREIVVSPDFHELERLRREALSNEASALKHAEKKGAAKEAAKWQGIVADKDAAITERDAAITEQAAEIARLKALLERGQ